MSRLSSELLEEMQSIFGGNFGASMAALSARNELMEARGGSAKATAQQAKGKGSGKKGRAKQSKDYDTRSAKSIERMARTTARENPDVDKTREQKGREALNKFRAVREKAGKKSSAAAGGGGSKAAKSSSGSGEKHYPFKRSGNLGVGPRDEKHNKSNCWKCNCSPMSGGVGKCNCTSTGAKSTCPKGMKKTITRRKSYKDDYNPEYRKFRSGRPGIYIKRLGIP